MLSKVNIWIILCLIGLASHELIDEVIRPTYGKGEGVIPFLLGVIPNFLAAGFIFPFAILSYRDYTISPHLRYNIRNLTKWFYGALIFTQFGLIVWEIMQLTGKLIFDWNDIFATILAGLFSVGLFYYFLPKYLPQS